MAKKLSIKHMQNLFLKKNFASVSERKFQIARWMQSNKNPFLYYKVADTQKKCVELFVCVRKIQRVLGIQRV